MTLLAIEVVHQWAQRLPLRDSMLVCIGCGQARPIGGPTDDVMSCAAVAAWQSAGATARGDFVSYPMGGGS